MAVDGRVPSVIAVGGGVGLNTSHKWIRRLAAERVLAWLTGRRGEPAGARFDRRDAGAALPRRKTQHCAAPLVAIEEHVLLAWEGVEDSHLPSVRFGDLAHRSPGRSPLEEQPREGIGVALPDGKALPG